MGSSIPVMPELPPVVDDSTLQPQPEVVIDSRIIQKGRYCPKEEILVKWMGAPVEDATWENKWKFLHSYHIFVLEDKDKFKGMEGYNHCGKQGMNGMQRTHRVAGSW